MVENEAGYDITSGYRNTSIGDSAGTDLSTGHHNTFIGQSSGACTEFASHNTFVRSYAGWDNNRTIGATGEGQQNTYLGAGCGYTNREGNYNVGMGAFADFRSTGYIGTNDNVGNVFIGTYSEVDEMYSIAIGYESKVYGMYTIGLGSNLRYDDNNTDYSIGMGYFGQADNAQNSVALGREHILNTADNSVAIGAYTDITNDFGMAIGYDANISGQYSSAFGYESNVASDSYMAFGYGSNIGTGVINSIAMGTNSTVSSSNAFVLGNTSNALRLGIGVTNPNQYAAIELAEKNKGLLVNRLTNAERTAFQASLTATEKGLIVYDTEDNALYTWDGAIWSSSTNTDTHLTEVEVDAMADDNGYLTSFSEVDGDITNEIQDLQLVGNDLTITNNGTATTIDLSAYLDDTDTDTQLSEIEVDAFVANNGYLTSFTELDGDATNELQDISLSGTDLTITNGSTIDLSSLQDGTGTDEQSLSLNDTELSISNGNTVDLSSILEPLEIVIDDLIHRIDSLESVITDCCGGTKVYTDEIDIDEAILYQNIPNPWGETTTINYYLPFTTYNARIEIRTAEGKTVSTINIEAKGDGHIIVSAGSFAEGIYFYSLIANNKLIDTKRFVLTQ